MPRYSRRPSTRTRRYRKTPWYSKRYSAIQLAAKAARGVRYLKGLVNSEMLHADTNFSSATVTGTGALNHLTALAQGDGSNARTGNSILLRSLAYRFKLEINASVTANTTVTMLILQDTQQVGDTQPAVTDVLSQAQTYSLLSTSTAGRFKIIKRTSFLLTPASGGRPAIESKGYLNMYSHVRYNGTASSDIQKNGLYVLFISSENVNYPTVSGSFRIGYHDN